MASSMALRSSTSNARSNQENEVFKTKGAATKPPTVVGQARSQRVALGDIKNRKASAENNATKKPDVSLKPSTATTSGLHTRQPLRATRAANATAAAAAAKNDAENQVPKRQMPLRKSVPTRSTTSLQAVKQPLATRQVSAGAVKAAAVVKRTNSVPQPVVKEVQDEASTTPVEQQQQDTAQQEFLTDDKTGLMRPSAAFATQMVYDIDAPDQDDPLMVAEYAMDIYDYMRHLENYTLQQQQCIPADYLGSSSKVTSRMRAILIDWLSQVHIRFHLLPETMYLTTALVDRFLSAIPEVAKDQLQLVGVSCMFVASKYEEIYAPEIDDFVYITDYTYSKQQVTVDWGVVSTRKDRNILAMEITILHTLKFQLGRPLSLNFLRRFSKANGSSMEVHTLAKYILELQMIDYGLCHVRPSLQAAAALRMVQCLFAKRVDAAEWSATLQYHTKYSHDDLLPVLRPLIKHLVKAHSKAYKLVALTRYQTVWPDVQIKFRPFFLAGVMKMTGNQPPMMVAAKGAYSVDDLHRNREYWQVPLTMIKDPFDTMITKGSLPSMRFLVSLERTKPDLLVPAARELFTRRWGRDEDIHRAEHLLQVCDAIGLDKPTADDVVAKIELQAVKDTLLANTKQAVDTYGVGAGKAFGAPWIVVHSGGKTSAFFGSDRFPQIAWMLGWCGKEFPGPRRDLAAWKASKM